MYFFLIFRIWNSESKKFFRISRWYSKLYHLEKYHCCLKLQNQNDSNENIFCCRRFFQVLTCGSIAKIIKRFPAIPKFEKISKIGEKMKIIINFCAAVLLILFTIGIIYLNYSVYHVFWILFDQIMHRLAVHETTA